jgi:hypothetical protein
MCPVEASPSPDDALLGLIDELGAIQLERVAAYQRLDVAFKAFVVTQSEGPYK